MINNKDKLYIKILKQEKKRQKEHIELIASENFVSSAVLNAAGSIFTNKYAEGYPGKRYYGGCENMDAVENLAIERLKQMFGVRFANVQSHSGSQANMAALRAILQPGDKILGMSLDCGGHLTHGYKLSFSGQDYEAHFYGVNKNTQTLDYKEIRKIALSIKPKVIIAGASAYSRFINFKKFKEIANEVGAYLVADIAHIAGLVVAGLHENPCEYADIVTSTTHKTLRGPRGGIIMTNNEELITKINRSLFPGIQGGPLMHIIAAKAIAFGEALKPSFKKYQIQVVKNAKAMSNKFYDLGFKTISNTTDNHLFMLDLTNKDITGAEAEKLLGEINITVNKNSIPFDTRPPLESSGIRIGTPAMTTKGYKEKDFEYVALIISIAIDNKDKKDVLKQLKKIVVSKKLYKIDKLIKRKVA